MYYIKGEYRFITKKWIEFGLANKKGSLSEDTKYM